MRRILCFAQGFGLIAALAHPRLAAASESQWWTSDSPADYAKSEARGILVHFDGTLSLGPATSSIELDSVRTIWAIAVLKDGSVALAADRGRVLRWTASGGVRPWAKLGTGQVLSLAADGDGAVAGTGPDGVVFRIGARGDTTRIARTGERYVWGLAPAGGGVWYAATGTRGKLLRIAAGKTTVVLDSDESNLVSMISDGHGGCFVGGDSKGRIVHASPSGELRTVFDATEDEIRALSLGPDGALYAAALSGSAVSDDGPGDDEGPSPAKAAVSLGRATVYRIVPDSTAIAWWTAPQPLVFALANGPRGLLAATGNRAAIYQLEQVRGASVLAAMPQGQATALAVGADGRIFAATANPAALWILGPAPASRGELLSPALDARRFARFGRLRWAGTGEARFATRSGNVDPPDTTWSAWTAATGDADGARIASPPARYLQWKVELTSGNARVSEVSASWREVNLPPRIEDLSVTAQGQGVREGELSPRSEAVTQTLPGGQKVEYSMTTTAQKPLRELPIWARGLRSLQWKGLDPNGDPLKYRVEVRPEDSGVWIEIGKDLEASAFSWNTNTLPDGRYRLRVIASDAAGNAVGEEATGEALSEPFTVDNTPPAITALDAKPRPGAAEIEGAAEDATSPLSRLEAVVDDGDWRTVTPAGGLSDRKRLTFSATLGDLKPGDHVISVRAVDLAGNAATRATRVRVTAGR